MHDPSVPYSHNLSFSYYNPDLISFYNQLLTVRCSLHTTVTDQNRTTLSLFLPASFTYW